MMSLLLLPLIVLATDYPAQYPRVIRSSGLFLLVLYLGRVALGWAVRKRGTILPTAYTVVRWLLLISLWGYGVFTYVTLTLFGASWTGILVLLVAGAMASTVVT